MRDERDQKWFSMSPYLWIEAEMWKVCFPPIDKRTKKKGLCASEASKHRVICMRLFFNQSSSIVKVLGNLILPTSGSKES